MKLSTNPLSLDHFGNIHFIVAFRLSVDLFVVTLLLDHDTLIKFKFTLHVLHVLPSVVFSSFFYLADAFNVNTDKI